MPLMEYQQQFLVAQGACRVCACRVCAAMDGTFPAMCTATAVQAHLAVQQLFKHIWCCIALLGIRHLLVSPEHGVAPVLLQPTVFCQVLAVSPAGPASTVYRVVPSTDIQLVTHNSSSSGSSGQESQAIGSTQQEAGGSAQPGSSSNSKTCSRPKSSSSHGQAAADTAKLPSSVFDKGKGSSSSSSTKKKKTCLTRSEAAAVTASASMFFGSDSVDND